MRLSRGWLYGIGLAALVGAGWACLHRDATADSKAKEVTGTAVLVLATAHDEHATTTEVRRVEVESDGVRSSVLATIPHPPGAVVRGDARGERIVVVADDALATDRDWGATLYRVEAGGSGARAVLGGVGHASRPLVGDDGLVYVERGSSGPMPTDDQARAGHLRDDAISIAAVDDAGSAKSVYSATGYALHLCGAVGNELVVYRVRFGGADLLAVDRRSGASRLVTELPPYARDFTIDRSRVAVVFSNRDATDVHRWVVDRVDLATGQTTELHAENDSAPAPFALASGGFAFTAPGRRGLAFDGGDPVAPLGAGFDATQAESADGAWLLVAHVPMSGYDETVALHRRTTRVIRLTSRDERIDAIGFVDGGSVVR